MKDSFTTGQVADITGIFPNTIKVWRRRGHIDIGDQKGWGRYTFKDVLRLALMKRLTGLGMDIAGASFVANHPDTDFALWEAPHQTGLVVAADYLTPGIWEGVDRSEFVYAHVLSVDAGTDPTCPVVPLVEPKPEGWSGGPRKSIGSSDFIFINLTQLHVDVVKAIELLESEAGDE